MSYTIINIKKFNENIEQDINKIINKNKILLNLGKITEYINNCHILKGIQKAKFKLNKCKR